MAALRHALSDDDAAVRGLAATGLGSLKAKDAVRDLFVALDHKVSEASASIGQLCAPAECDELVGKLGKLPFDVVTGGLDQVLFRPPTEVDDDEKVKMVGHVRELGTAEANRFLKDVQKRWPATWSPRVKQAIDQGVLATGGAAMTRAMHGAGRSPVALGACGGGQTPLNLFTTDWTDDSGRSIERVQTKLAGAHPRPGVDVVVAVAGNADKLIGQPLGAGGGKWTFAHPLDTRPILAGTVVIGSGGGELFALDARAGKQAVGAPDRRPEGARRGRRRRGHRHHAVARRRAGLHAPRGAS